MILGTKREREGKQALTKYFGIGSMRQVVDLDL